MPAEVANVRREHIEAFLADLLERRSASTAKTRHGGLHVFFKRCVDDGESTGGLSRDFARPYGNQTPIDRPTTMGSAPGQVDAIAYHPI